MEDQTTTDQLTDEFAGTGDESHSESDSSRRRRSSSEAPNERSSEILNEGTGGDDDGETCIYFVAEYGPDFMFYRIPNDKSPTQLDMAIGFTGEEPSESEFLEPVISLDRRGSLSPGFAALGTTIYACGGGILPCSGKPVMYGNLFSIDTAHPNEGWAEGKAMQFPRRDHLCLFVNKQMYAFGGLDTRDLSKEMPTEAYNPANDTWTEKVDIDPSHQIVVAGADYNGGKQVLLLTLENNLLIYNVDNDNFAPSCIPEQVYGHPFTLAVLDDHILFTGTWSHAPTLDMVFQLTGIDLLSKKGRRSPVAVTGLEQLMDCRSDYVLPAPYTKIRTKIGKSYNLCPRIRLIPIGEMKLAVLWTLDAGNFFYVNCLKMEIRKEDIGQDRFSLTAHSGSFSSHRVQGSNGVLQYIPVKKENGASQVEDVAR